MNKYDAEKLSILMMQINSKMDQSAAFVRDKCTDSEFKEYRGKAGQVMGRVIDILHDIYEQHPDLKPEQVGGTYKVDPEVFESTFYRSKNV